ncbi:hypothetical protein [Denitrobaculum tricleocarpae]|uniref:Uncharacterized protein n=1 Tax=Denitrobaculum tricleocarpae TaxID=2591009 RepID=A0A545TWQ7_9PROT|nr:hypothetical protein [Denitrobaculum tricleocarpae]TQV81642.1 hypothetical protein FKG95_05165 [Denitrobaculum tricleocarpae]
MTLAFAEAINSETVDFTGYDYPGTGLFLCDLEATLRRLRGIRLRLTLSRIDFPLGQEAALELATAIDDHSVIAGYDASGRLLILYLGPRPEGPRGDAVAFTTIMSKLREALDREGHVGIEGGRIETLHGWSDALADSKSMLRELDQVPAIPLAAVIAHAA